MEKEDVALRDDHLNEITKLTLKSEVDKILKKKQPLSDLKDIFHYENKPCPRLILIMGGPGEYDEWCEVAISGGKPQQAPHKREASLDHYFMNIP